MVLGPRKEKTGAEITKLCSTLCNGLRNRRFPYASNPVKHVDGQALTVYAAHPARYLAQDSLPCTLEARLTFIIAADIRVVGRICMRKTLNPLVLKGKAVVNRENREASRIACVPMCAYSLSL